MSDAMIGMGLRMSPRHPQFPAKSEELAESPRSREAGVRARFEKEVQESSVGGRTHRRDALQKESEANPLEVDTEEEGEADSQTCTKTTP